MVLSDSSEWIERVREEFVESEQVRLVFRAGLERGDLSSLSDQDWPYTLVPKPLPREIWIYWAQGWDNAPDIVSRCRDSWAKHNPDWRLNMLDDSNAADYADIGKVTEGKTIGIAHSADILRLNLLSRYGGVWVDASTVCTRPLENWLPLLMQSGFFAFSTPRPDRALSNWFLASEPDGVIVRRWLDLVHRYWSLVTEADHYFWCHYLFAHGCRTDRTFAAGWANTPHLSAHGALQPQLLAFPTNAANEAIASIAASTVPVFKLSHRREVRHDDPQDPYSLFIKALLA